MHTTLAEIVNREHLLPEARLMAALRQARASGEALVAVLVELEGLDDALIAGALARHLRLPLGDVDGEPDDDALREVGYDTARARRVVPLGLVIDDADGVRVLRLGMADPTDLDTVGDLEAQSGCRVEPVLAKLGDIDEAIGRVYRGFVTAVMPAFREQTDPGLPRRIPFGGNLQVGDPAAGTAEYEPGLGTAPFHNLEDEAPLELRHRALLELLVARGLITLDDYWNELRRLLKEHE